MVGIWIVKVGVGVCVDVGLCDVVANSGRYVTFFAESLFVSL